MPADARAAQVFDARVTFTADGMPFLEWTDYDGADSYRINVVSLTGEASDVTYSESSSLSLYEVLPSGGRYSFTVTALRDGEELDFAYATYDYIRTLDAPADFSFSDGTVSWQSVPDATGYEILVNGICLGTSADNLVDLSEKLLAGGDFVLSVTALGDEYNTPSEAATFAFSLPAPPLPPYDILLCLSAGRYIASWTPMTDDAPDGYVYRVEYDSSTLTFATTTENFADLTAYIAADGIYTVGVACVADGETGEFFFRSFKVENGVPAL